MELDDWQCPNEKTISKGTWCAAKIASRDAAWWRKADFSSFENRDVKALNGHSDDQSELAMTLRELELKPFLTYVKGQGSMEMRVESWYTDDGLTGTSVCRFLKPEVEAMNRQRLMLETWFEDGKALFSSDIALDSEHTILIAPSTHPIETYNQHRERVRKRLASYRALRSEDAEGERLMNQYYTLFCTEMKSQFRSGFIAWFEKKFGSIV